MQCSGFSCVPEKMCDELLLFYVEAERDEIRISFGSILFNDDENQEVEYTSNQSYRKKG